MSNSDERFTAETSLSCPYRTCSGRSRRVNFSSLLLNSLLLRSAQIITVVSRLPVAKYPYISPPISDDSDVDEPDDAFDAEVAAAAAAVIGAVLDPAGGFGIIAVDPVAPLPAPVPEFEVAAERILVEESGTPPSTITGDTATQVTTSL